MTSPSRGRDFRCLLYYRPARGFFRSSAPGALFPSPPRSPLHGWRPPPSPPVTRCVGLRGPAAGAAPANPKTTPPPLPPPFPPQRPISAPRANPSCACPLSQEFSLGAPLLLRRPPLRNKRASLILFLRAQVVRPKCLRPRSYNHYARPQIRRTVLWAIEARLPSAIRSSPSVASIITGGACSNASSSSGVKASSMRLARRA